MKISFLFLCFCLLFLGCSSDSSRFLVACGDGKAIIIDEQHSAGTDVKIVWTWDIAEVKDLPIEYQKLMVPLDECKPVNNGKQLLLTSSGGGAVLADLKTKKSLFYAHVPMAHSAEILPDNRIVVALSTHRQGNSIELYDIARPEVVLFRDSLYSGHGVVWNEKHELLYALGYDELRAYSLQDWKTSTPFLKLEKTWIIPETGGHDLMAVTEDELVLSSGKNVWLFDIPRESFSVFSPLENKSKIKSVNYDRSTGSLIYTQGEIEWWTHHIYLKNPDKTLEIPDINLYKVWVFDNPPAI